ncbi:glycosyltransferase family 2 protein [Phocaeicola sp.]
MFLSVIIPVYNVEPYLHRCIDSVIAQNMGNEIELLLIDDGSKDASGYICDEYSKMYSWIHTFHIPNGGVGNARNYGIKHAQGDYFTFIDSDDFLDPGLYKEIYHFHKKQPSDLYTFGYKDYPMGNGSSHSLENRRCNSEVELALLYLELKQNYLMFPVFNKIFKYADNYNSRFSIKVHYYEDYLFTLECLNKVKSACVINMPAYNYVHHSGEHLGGKYTVPEVVVEVAKELKKRSDLLSQNKELTQFTVVEYYNNLLHAVDNCQNINDSLKYIRILLTEIKRYGFLSEFKQYLGRRRILMTFQNSIWVLPICYIRRIILKI